MILTSLIAPFALLAAAPAAPAAEVPKSNAEIRFNDCVHQIAVDHDKAIAGAEAWRAAGGGVPARQCLGLAYVAVERWVPAAIAFEQAATEAESRGDGRAATLWVQSGNAALAGDDAVKARAAFDHALALPVLSGMQRGEALMDRARADVAVDDLKAARTDLDEAIKLVPSDPMGWLLSAALARRQGDTDRAHNDLTQAEKLAPGDPSIAAERARVSEMRSVPDAATSAP